MRSRTWNSLVFWSGLLCGTPVWAVSPTPVSNQETHSNGGIQKTENIHHSASPSATALYRKARSTFPPTQPAAELSPASTQARDLQQPSPPSNFDLAEKFSEPIFSKGDSDLGELQVEKVQQPSKNEGDPDLGELQVEELPLSSPEGNGTSLEEPQQPTLSDPDAGELPIEGIEDIAPTENRGELGDQEELGGEIPIQKLPPPAPPRPRPPRPQVVFLQGRLDYFRTSNVFSGIDPIDDALFRSGISLLATPRLGPRTFLIAGADGNIVHYANEVRINYDELRFRAGIFHQLSPRMYGEIGWTNQQLFFGSDNLGEAFQGERFLNDHAIRLELSRQDPLSKRLLLTTFYQLRLSFAEPENRSRLINSFFASLSYTIFPALQAGLDYQFALADFTQEDRQDRYHQVLLRLTYRLSNQARLTAFGGYSFGGSSVSTINFDGGIFGVSLSVNLPLF